jgi:TP901 family phage tail tape measure protein
MARQPETKVKFSIFNKDFNDGIAEINRESTSLRKEFKLQEEQLKQNGSATDLLHNKINRLSAEQELTKRKIEATADQLAKAKRYYGENSNEANRLSNTLLDLRISEQKIANAISQSRQDLQQQGQAMNSTERDAKSLSKALHEVSQSSKELGKDLSGKLSLPMAGVGVTAGKMAVDIDGAVRLMNGSLGATGDEAKQLEEDLRSVWSDGVGDNPEATARAMLLVKQNIQGINEGKPLQEVTKDIINLSNVTESDVSEVTRGVNQLMHNFGLTSKEAMDLFAKGFSQNLNYSNEMFDNIAEYAPLFKQMGFSAEEYFTILANGSQNGAYSLDYINDVMKEFDIRLRDGSKTTSDAFSSMSQKTQDMFQKFKDGKLTTQELFNVVIPELEKMDDQVLANQIGVGLFGTKFEDMGSKTVYSLNDVNSSLQSTKGSMDALSQSQEESFGTKLQSSLRSLGAALEPIGVILVNMLLSLQPYLERFALWFQNLSPIIQKVMVLFGLLAGAIGPLIVALGFIVQGIAGAIPVFVKIWSIISKLRPLFTALRIAMLALTGPVGIIIATIAVLVTAFITLWQKNEAFRNFFINLWENIKVSFVLILTAIKVAATTIWEAIKLSITIVITTIKTIYTATWNAIKAFTVTIFTAIKVFATTIWKAIQTGIILYVTLIQTVYKTIWNGIKAFTVTVFNAIKNTITSVWNAIKNTTTSVFNNIKSVASSVWNSIKSSVTSVVNAIRSTITSVWNGIKSNTSSVFGSIKSTATSVWNGIKSAIVTPIQSAKSTLLGIIDSIKGAFSSMKITIPKPKLPKIDISKGIKSIAGIDIPYPKFNVSWHKTGGVMTKPFVAGNAGFGDVEEGIVPFEGAHAMKIAKLIAAAQSKLSDTSSQVAQVASDRLMKINIAPSQVIMDGYEVGSIVWEPVADKINTATQINMLSHGVKF